MSDKPPANRRPWYVYIVKCADGSLYTGITTDVLRRLCQHDSGQGAKYTRARGPLQLLGCEMHPDRSSASRAEYAIKQLTASEKRERAKTMRAALPV